ncbi:tautomerase family protein [Herbiconiux sp.]|uniref:tautomerase family protein n=1 Tax=Herbiconiux sp. TaxID=1871186 RepID=UPI0025C1E44A|nr:tautomerase family protein [Herbiconiux sp.]
MPIIEISLAAGRDPQQVRTLLADVHEAVLRSLGEPQLQVRVLVREIPPEHWLSNGVTLAEIAEKASAATTTDTIAGGPS